MDNDFVHHFGTGHYFYNRDVVMKTYHVIFYYKGEPSYKGDFDVQADNDEMAAKVVNLMIESRSHLIPGNWDIYKIYES